MDPISIKTPNLTDSPAAIGTHVEGREVHTAKRLLKGTNHEPNICAFGFI
jgi:hypothetical protein